MRGDRASRIVLLTDFGTADGYVAAMRGVIASIAPSVAVDDASHDIAPGDVLGAAFVLARYAPLFPRGTVHLVVVDPGVGTARRALAASIGEQIYVAPDNGVLTRVLQCTQGACIVELGKREFQRGEPSATFHGRDVFAPAAAHLAAGLPIDRLGPAVSDPVTIALPSPVRDAHRLRGVVVHVDGFGNLISNIPRAWTVSGGNVVVGGHEVGAVRRTYADVASGTALALIGSDDLLEVAVGYGSAAAFLGCARGAPIEVIL
jgi:S-adenosylmethionine hydrolase